MTAKTMGLSAHRYLNIKDNKSTGHASTYLCSLFLLFGDFFFGHFRSGLKRALKKQIEKKFSALILFGTSHYIYIYVIDD